MQKLKALLSRAATPIRWVLLVAVVGFAIFYLVRQWDDVSFALKQISLLSLVLSFGLLLTGVVAATLGWVAVLNGLGPKVSTLRAMQVMLVGQLGKYVPGSVWSYVMQMELGRQYGVARPRVLISGLYAAGIGVVASLLLGSLALPVVLQGHSELLWLFALLPVGLVCLHPRVMTWLSDIVLRIFRRAPLEHQVNFRTVLSALGWTLLAYLFYGAHLWVLVNALDEPSFGSLLLLTGAIGLGFTLGLFAFFLPSGVGVRELVLVGSMTTIITAAQATAISLVSRVMFTISDLLAAGVAVLAVFLLRHKLSPTVNEYAEVEPAPQSPTATET